MLSNDWGYERLETVVSFSGGGTPSKKNAAFWDGDIPWVSPKDMKLSKINDSIDHVTSEAIKNSSAKLLPKGSILIVVRSGILARTVPVGITGRCVAVNQDIKALLPSNRISSDFLYYFMKSQERNLLSQVTRSATVHRLQSDVLKSIKVPVPTLPEQKRIVDILDEAFEGVATATANAEKNLANARELFESYLKSMFSEKREHWTEQKLGNVCQYFNGKAHEKLIDEDGQFFVVNSKFISTNGRVVKKSNHSLFPLMPNDITMVLSDVPNGKALAKCFLIENANTYTLNQRICVIKSDSFHTKFLYYQINRNPYFLSFNNGENQTNLRKGQILDCPLFIPPMAEQEMIADNLELLQSQTIELEAIYQQKLNNLAELKQSILQKAFTGELTKLAA